MTHKRIRWGANFAYIVGLITTDGNLSSDKRHLDFTSKDLDQILNFKKILELKNKIGLKTSGTSDKKYFCLRFGNVKLYNFLLDIGLTPCKSKTLKGLDIPDKYFTDFLRGHLDGDGSIINYTDNYNFYKGVNYSNNRVMVYFISASKQHLEWLERKILLLLGSKGALIDKKPNYIATWRLKYSKSASVNLLKHIYYKPSLPCLERKKKIAKSILAAVTSETRRKYTKHPNP